MNKKIKMTVVLMFAVCAMVGLTQSVSAQSTPVDMMLVLAVDVSSSVNATEFGLQKKGYVDAFNSAAVYDKIIGPSGNGSIAVAFVYWSTYNQQQTAVDWTLINNTDGTRGTDFAALVNATARPFSGTTGIGAAINYSTGLFSTNAFTGDKWVIDVSGDGSNNSNGPSGGISPHPNHPDVARDAALAAGVDVINGITITDSSSVQQHYIDNVIGGTDAFHVNAEDFEAFGGAIEQKLLREIDLDPDPDPGVGVAGVVPEPSTMLLLGGGLFGAYIRRRKKV